MGCVKSKQRLLPRKVNDEDWKNKVIPHPDRRKHNIVIEFDADNSQRSVALGNTTVSIITADRNEIESIYEGVDDGEVLGYGIGGLVRLVTHKETGTQFALKTLSLDRISQKGLKQVQEEIEILMELDHPNIVKLDFVYQTDDEIYIVQELCRGGDLFDRLDAQPEEHYSEAQCARLVKKILSAVRYIHSKGIIHRDLKLENFLFDSSAQNSELKMIDFGLSKHFKTGDTHHEPVGTRYTVAPEVLLGTYDEKVDIWAIGVITYLLLSGNAPFGGCYEGDKNVDVRNKILRAEFSFEPEEYWQHVSQEAKDFICELLVLDPKQRPTAEACQHSEWLMKNDVENNSKINPNVIKALQSFRKFSDMRKLLCEVIGFTLLPEQISILRNDFEKLDVEQTGEITLDGLKQVLLANTENGVIDDFIESEIDEIFNSMRLHNSDTTIHWHSFLAAGLSELPVDERNHRLAFDKIDKERKGHITFQDLMEISPEKFRLKSQDIESEWTDSVQLCKAGSRITYEDFVKIMEIDEAK